MLINHSRLAVHSDKGYFTVTIMALTSIKQKVSRKEKKTNTVSPQIDGIFLIQLIILNAVTSLTSHQVLPCAELWTALALSSYAEAGSLSESKVVIS